MRYVINISLPESMVREVNVAVKKGGYASKSEFIRDLLRSWKEDQLFKELRKSQAEFKQGKGKLLKSLRDLRS